MTVDRELVTRKILLIVRDLDSVRPIAGRALDEYLQSSFDQAVAERHLERMIGRMIDINFHLITETGEAPPSDYHASFVRLAEMRILDSEFARRIARSAGLRNRIVHEYNEIDPRRVFEGLQDALADVPAYLQKIERHLDRLPS